MGGIRNRRLQLLFGVLCFFTVTYFLLLGISSPSAILVNFSGAVYNFLRERTSPPFQGVDVYTNYTLQRLAKSSIGLKLSQLDLNSTANQVSSFQYLINVTSCGKEEVTVLIAVISAANHFEKRNKIRQTWFLHLNITRHKLLFVLARREDKTIQKRIDEESRNHGDILQIDIDDIYHNLAVKDVALLYWLNQNCPRFHFILKCDDDVYVNVRNLMDLISTLSIAEPAMYGNYNPYGLVIRNTGKYGVSFDDWPWRRYPAYFSGGSSIISGKAVAPLLAAAQVTPFFKFEDVYLSGLVAKKANVTLIPSNRIFAAVEVPGSLNDPCFAMQFVSWLTKSGQEMVEFHRITEKVMHQKVTCSQYTTTN